MNAATIERIQNNVEQAAAAFLAGAVAFATLAGLRPLLPPLQLALCACAAALLAYLLCNKAMGVASQRGHELPLSIFDVRDLEPFESDELLLTEADRVAGELVLTHADRLQVEHSAGEEPLLLDDPLPAPHSDSRVVQLFDRKAMPTPGQLQSRIDDHLAGASPRPGQSDASQALAAALAELRRSLR
jgi:hypothetical protein